MDEQLHALEVLDASARRLAVLVDGLTPDQLRHQAYPTEWTVADVLSHLGSGAVISKMRLEAMFDGTQVGNDDAQPIWDEWNAKSPEDKTADFLRADRSLLDALAGLSADDRSNVHLAFGPVEFGFDGFVGLRLNEHALHSWDIAVTFDPAASIPLDAVGIVVDNLSVIAGFVAKPTGAERRILVGTSDPVRRFEIALTPEAVSFTPGPAGGTADLQLPAEGLVRLVYGRLDPDHTPAFVGQDADLDELRRAFPGV
jgi:uncharacterized protein (TIGR03083 family)